MCRRQLAPVPAVPSPGIVLHAAADVVCCAAEQRYLLAARIERHESKGTCPGVLGRSLLRPVGSVPCPCITQIGERTGIERRRRIAADPAIEDGLVVHLVVSDLHDLAARWGICRSQFVPPAAIPTVNIIVISRSEARVVCYTAEQN